MSHDFNGLISNVGISHSLRVPSFCAVSATKAMFCFSNQILPALSQLKNCFSPTRTLTKGVKEPGLQDMIRLFQHEDLNNLRFFCAVCNCAETNGYRLIMACFKQSMSHRVLNEYSITMVCAGVHCCEFAQTFSLNSALNGDLEQGAGTSGRLTGNRGKPEVNR